MAAHKKGKTGKTATGDPQMEQPGGPIVLAAGSRRCLFGWIGLLQDPVLENGHSQVVIEFSLKDPAAIQEFGNTFNWVLPSIDQAVHKPYAYQLLFKSVTFDIPYDEEGNINLLDLKDRNFALSIEKKCFDNGEIVPRIVNLIAYSD